MTEFMGGSSKEIANAGQGDQLVPHVDVISYIAEGFRKLRVFAHDLVQAFMEEPEE